MMLLRARECEIRFPRRPMVMGIVNINDDSFCGDGSLDPDQAVALATQQIKAGAEIIDVGAESARTNRGPIPLEEEVARLRPFIEAFPAIADGAGMPEAILSVNTWRPEVVRQVLPLGVDLLNDMGALPEADNARLCAEHGTALLIMHSVGQPKQPHPDTKKLLLTSPGLWLKPPRAELANTSNVGWVTYGAFPNCFPSEFPAPPHECKCPWSSLR